MRTSILALVAVVTLAAVAVAGGAAAGGSSVDHDNGVGANYTVDLPSDEDHYPGTQGGAASINHFAAGGGVFEDTSSPKGLKRMDQLIISNQDIVFGECSTEDTAAFGLDYGNNNSGTETDEDLLQHRENSEFREHAIYLNFFGPDSIAGTPVRFNAVDEIVAAQRGCYVMPDEPGWYQINARVNGTGYDDSYIDSADQGEIKSHYFYICECSSRSEAESQLGPAPSDDSGGDGDSGGGGASTATPTATATATATATPEPSNGGGGSTQTATATATATPTATATATPEPSNDGGGSTQTPTATAASDGSDTGGDGGAAAGTATATPSGGSAQQNNNPQQGSGPATPTVGAGPGFGLVAALGGLVAVALLAFRRD